MTVQDSSFHYQINIQLKGEKLIDYYCNCNQFRTDGLCSHVVAAIFFVRQRSSPIKQERASSKGPKSKELPRIKNLLSSISQDSIADFLFDYSKKDELFRLLFYARFIDQLEPTQIPDFIDRVFPVIKTSQTKIQAKKIRQFTIVSQELMGQVQMYFSQQDLLKAFQIVFLLLKKSFYISHYIEEPNPVFDPNHLELIRNYNEVFKSIEAPEFKERAHEMQLELLQSSFVKADIVEERKLWAPFIENEQYRDQIREIISQHLNDSAQKSSGTRYFLIMLELMVSRDDELDDRLVLQSYQGVYRIIHLLIENHYFHGSYKTLKRIFVVYPLKYQLAFTLLKAIPPDTIDRDIFHRCIEFFEISSDMRFIEYMRKSSYWESDQSVIEKNLVASSDKEPLIKYYLYVDDMTKAKRHLTEGLSIQLIERVDEMFALKDQVFLLDSYQVLTREYLNDHFGIKTLSFVDRVKRRIVDWGGDVMLGKFNKFIVKEFPSRKYLF